MYFEYENKSDLLLLLSLLQNMQKLGTTMRFQIWTGCLQAWIYIFLFLICPVKLIHLYDIQYLIKSVCWVIISF